MKLFVGKNDTGKTRELIKYSLEQDIPILALYNSKAESLRAKSINYFGKLVKVVTPNDLMQNGYAGDILVDDLEKAFATLLSDFVRSSNFNITGASITED
jgi:hypothetical protein